MPVAGPVAVHWIEPVVVYGFGFEDGVGVGVGAGLVVVAAVFVASTGSTRMDCLV